jgi:large subunit ribosomal protein L35
MVFIVEVVFVSKMKNHSGASKRFSVTGSGKLKRARAAMRHGLRKRPKDMKGKPRFEQVKSCDAQFVKKAFFPNGIS